MNLRDLEYVTAVADHGHFGRAAEACAVSQPTLSGQILKLEKELGVAIFERDGRTIRLTQAGESILAHARAAVAAAAAVQAAARAARDPLAGALRIGVIPTVGPYLAPWLLPAAARALPAAPIRLFEDITERLLGLLGEGRLDAAALATDPPRGGRLESLPLYDEPFLLLVARDHPLAGLPCVDVRDLDPKSLLLLADGHCLRDQTLDLCGGPEFGAAGADMRATSLETLLHLTAAGQGVTLAPLLAIRSWKALTQSVVAVPLARETALRKVQLVFRRDMPRRAALEILAQTARDAVRTATPARTGIEDAPAPLRRRRESRLPAPPRRPE